MLPKEYELLIAATETGAGPWRQVEAGVKSFQFWGATSSGSGSATVKIQGSIDKAAAVDLDDPESITLETTVAAGTSDGYTSDDRYVFIRAYVTAISGTGAWVTCKASA